MAKETPIKNIRTFANLSSIGQAGQDILSKSEIGVVGVGGVGGIIFELLVRAGIGKIRIADGGIFEESNANRQSLWTSHTNNKAKTQAALEFAHSVNPACKVICFSDITAKNAYDFARGCNTVIGSTDQFSSRLHAWHGCKQANIPYVFAAAAKTRGMISVFYKKDFEKEFCMLGARLTNSPSPGTFGPAANTIGCLSAQQAINIMLKKPTVLFPSVLSLDLFSKNPITVHDF